MDEILDEVSSMRGYRGRGIKGLVVYRVNKDLGVFRIDLILSDMMVEDATTRFRSEFSVLDGLEEIYGNVVKGLSHTDLLCRYRGRPILCRIFTRGDRVVYVLMASISIGILRQVLRKLENHGWKKLFYIEFVKLKSRTR